VNFSRTDNGDDTVIRIEGVLDAVTAPEIRPLVDSLIRDQRMAVGVDLAALRLIDSSGVGVIVSLYKRAKVYGGVVKITGLRDQPLTIFKLLRLDKVFSVP